MIPSPHRRRFIKGSLALAAGLGGLIPRAVAQPDASSPAKGRFRLSLAEWSLRDWIRSGKITNLEFPRAARENFGIHAVEYVSTFFDGQERSRAYLDELKTRTRDLDVANVLIMVDMHGPDGALASPASAVRANAARQHHRWVDAAKALGCHAIRVNARGYDGSSYEDAKGYFADGLSQLVSYAKQADISVVVENHGGLSSNGRWLSEVMQAVDDPHCGTLPDFGNFLIDKTTGIFYDPLVGLAELMPYAKGVSAKANQFGRDGYESTIDYVRMINIIEASSFSGYIGVEWGGRLGSAPPEEGIRSTKALLEKLLPLG